MHVFTNKFTVAVNHDKSEVILNFYQRTPDVPTDTGPVDLREIPTTLTPVSNLVMSGQCAQNLVATLASLLSQPDK